MGTPETTVYTAFMISYCVVGIIITYFVFSIIRQQRRNLELHRRNIVAEISTLESERARMSSDLHDEMGPVLSVIKFKIDAVSPDDPEEAEMLKEASHQIDQVLERLRAIARNLMPSTLVRKGLVVALREFVEAVNQNQSLHLSFAAQVSTTLDQDKSINLFRIIQEMIQNSIRHAHATEMLLQIKEEHRELSVLVQDNGIGFDYEKVIRQSSGLGLRNMRSRVEIMKGKLFVQSEENKGTSYLIKLPL